MDERDFEGSDVLEKLVRAGALDEFYEAIDADDSRTAMKLMKRAGIHANTIAIVLKKMAEADGFDVSR